MEYGSGSATKGPENLFQTVRCCLTWSFEMWNGKGENGLSIFFPSPFLGDDDSLLDTPDFGRLAAWRSIAARWLGRESEALDEEGAGFRKSGH